MSVLQQARLRGIRVVGTASEARADVVPDEVPDRVGAQATADALAEEAPSTDAIVIKGTD